MATIEIDGNVIQKLTHESAEIRLRTLQQIFSKFLRAQTHKEVIKYKSDALCKQLIRWFGYKPLQAPIKALELLLLVVQDPVNGPKVIHQLGAHRIKKELNKIQNIIKNHSEKVTLNKKLNELIEVIDTHIENEIKNVETLDRQNNDEIIVDSDHKSIILNILSETKLNDDDYFEASLSHPLDEDFTSMTFIADILKNPSATNEELENALSHLQVTIHDYPVEHLLQRPHIFCSLLFSFDETRNDVTYCTIRYLMNVFLEFLDILKREMKQKRKTLAVSIPASLVRSSKSSLTVSESEPPLSKVSMFTSTSSMTSYDSTESINENKPTEKFVQLRIEKAISLLLNACTMHLEIHIEHGQIEANVWNVIYSIIDLHKSNNWNVESKYIIKIAEMVHKLHMKINQESNESCCRLRMLQIHLLLLLPNLLSLCVVDDLLEHVKIFHCIITDIVFTTLFRQDFEIMLKYFFKEDKLLMELLTTLDVYKKSFTQAAKIIIKKLDADSNKENLTKSCDIQPVIIEKLQSVYLVDALFNGIIDCMHLYSTNTDLHKIANDLLLKLLNLNTLPLKLHGFKRFLHIFKQHIGSLMDKQMFFLNCENTVLLNANIVGVPLSEKLFLLIIYELMESTDSVVKDNCATVLKLFLKSHLLFGSYWNCLVYLILPAMPLLMCCTFSDSLMKVLMNLYDPDVNHMPSISLLQSNIAIMFHSQHTRRNEAMTRLLYILNSALDANKYLPNIIEISDTVPNDLCLIDNPKSMDSIFNDKSDIGSNSKRTLNNLLQLLDTADVEPLIRKTTLMQINVLCDSWSIVGEFCQAGAYFLVMRVLDNALQKSSYQDYPDSAIYAVSILMKVLLYDSTLRCELAQTLNIYHLLLRSLIMYMHDIQVRQDAAICLFLLLFAHHLVITEDFIEAPKALGYIQAPLQLKYRAMINNKDSETEYERVKHLFTSDTEENNFWRLSFAQVCCNGYFENVNRNIITTQTRIDINQNFKLTLQDIKWIRYSQPAINVQRILRSASNATSHISLIQALRLLKSQLFLKMFNAQNNFDDQASDIVQNVLIKFLQIPPGNEDDFRLLEEVMDIAYITIKLETKNIIVALASILQKDTQNTLLTLLLKGSDIPLNIFLKITLLLKEFLMKYKFSEDRMSTGDFFVHFFKRILKRTRELLTERHLKSVRCLLFLLLALSECPLRSDDEELFMYCKHLIKLSTSLKATTRTGSNCHRLCLLIVLKLTNQMEECYKVFRFSDQIIRFLSGLCGHRDVEVRILAWTILSRLGETVALKPIAKANADEITDTTEDAKSIDLKEKSGSELLINILSYLPGGFMACCLATLTDKTEVVCVRQLAGHLLATLITKKSVKIEETIDLLSKYKFFDLALESIHPSVCILSKDLPEYFEITPNGISNCEMISSFVSICYAMSRESSEFLDELASQPFMFALYEVLKRPPPEPCHQAFLILISDIYRLYTLHYVNHFSLLQQTVCRDAIWLKRYCEFMFIHNTYENLQDANFMVDTLQFLMVLSKNKTTFEMICEHLSAKPVEFMKLFKQAFSIGQLASRLQVCALSAFSLLLIKSQPELEENDKCVTLLQVLEKSISNNLETISLIEDDDHKAADTDISEKELTVAQSITHALIDLYTHIYPMKVCKFISNPTNLQHQVSETLSLLLKVSTSAQKAAYNMKLINKVLNIFTNFFEDFSGSSCTAFVRRHGEMKKNAVILNLILLLKFLLYWHSSQMMVLKEDNVAAELTKMLIQIWPWQVHSGEMKLVILQLCAFLSERSLVVCKQFSTFNSAIYGNSILLIVGKCVMYETSKVKAINTDCLPIIEAGLRILMNCCSCVEGRTGLLKLHILDIFDLILTFKPLTSRPRSELQSVWLRFWELYSRYEEGAHVCHLNALCYAVTKFCPNSKMRLLVLRILFNMCFISNNRSALISSPDFIYIVDDIVTQPMKDNGINIISYEEQFLMCVALWKLISGGVKFITMIRGTKLAKNLRMVHESLKNQFESNTEIPATPYASDLLKTLKILLRFLGK